MRHFPVAKGLSRLHFDLVEAIGTCIQRVHGECDQDSQICGLLSRESIFKCKNLGVIDTSENPDFVFGDEVLRDREKTQSSTTSP